jgi:hypothetical protein
LIALRRISFFICLSISSLGLAAGYAIAGQWVGSVITIMIAAAWLWARRRGASTLADVCLFSSICLGVAGLLLECPRLLMICGAGFSLASWDLLHLDRELSSSSYEAQTRRHESRHLQSLAVALICGLLIAFIGPMLHFGIPFVVMIACIVVLAFGFERIWRTLKEPARRIH